MSKRGIPMSNTVAVRVRLSELGPSPWNSHKEHSSLMMQLLRTVLILRRFFYHCCALFASLKHKPKVKIKWKMNCCGTSNIAERPATVELEATLQHLDRCPGRKRGNPAEGLPCNGSVHMFVRCFLTASEGVSLDLLRDVTYQQQNQESCESFPVITWSFMDFEAQEFSNSRTELANALHGRPGLPKTRPGRLVRSPCLVADLSLLHRLASSEKESTDGLE